MASRHATRATIATQQRKLIEGVCPKCLNQIHLLVQQDNPTPNTLDIPRHQESPVLMCSKNGDTTVQSWRGGQPIFNQ